MAVELRSPKPGRVVDVDGAQLDAFELPADAESLEALLRDLFETHWHEIVFGPIIQGAAFEWRALQAPTHIGMFDGYLTVAFGVPHFHLCIGEHKGMPGQPVAQGLAHHRRTARAELYRRLCQAGTPVSWGLRLFNGKGEQQITILLPNPFLDRDTDKVLKTPDWSQLALWDRLRACWLGLDTPDPFDRSGKGFHHD
ncbi:MAG: hypothetical protein ACLP8A_06650 [Methylovirgula sp.]